MVERLAAVDCLPDGLEKDSVFDRLLKKVDRAAFHRANAGIYFAKPREKYDGQGRCHCRQPLLNLEAANTWKIQIQQGAAELRNLPCLDELVERLVRCNRVTVLFKKARY